MKKLVLSLVCGFVMSGSVMGSAGVSSSDLLPAELWSEVLANCSTTDLINIRTTDKVICAQASFILEQRLKRGDPIYVFRSIRDNFCGDIKLAETENYETSEYLLRNIRSGEIIGISGLIINKCRFESSILNYSNFMNIPKTPDCSSIFQNLLAVLKFRKIKYLSLSMGSFFRKDLISDLADNMPETRLEFMHIISEFGLCDEEHECLETAQQLIKRSTKITFSYSHNLYRPIPGYDPDQDKTASEASENGE